MKKKVKNSSLETNGMKKIEISLKIITNFLNCLKMRGDSSGRRHLA